MANHAGLVKLADFYRELNGLTLKTALLLGRQGRFPKPAFWPSGAGVPLFKEAEIRAFIDSASPLTEYLDGEPPDNLH